MATLTVTSPVGGEVWTRGQSYPITWTSTQVGGTVTIQTYKGGVLVSTQDTIASNDGSWLFVTNAASTNVGNNFKIRITNNSDESWGESAGNFTFLPASGSCTANEISIPLLGCTNSLYVYLGIAGLFAYYMIKK